VSEISFGPETPFSKLKFNGGLCSEMPLSLSAEPSALARAQKVCVPTNLEQVKIFCRVDLTACTPEQPPVSAAAFSRIGREQVKVFIFIELESRNRKVSNARIQKSEGLCAG
jgi:hypothetical protein